MVKYFAMVGHFVMVGHFAMVGQRPFIANQADVILYHLHSNFQVIMDQKQENKDTK